MTQRFVYTDGVWDLLHPNHINLMEEVLTYGDRLLIGVITDEMALRYKRQPIMNQDDRMRAVRALRIVSEAGFIDGPLDDGTVIADIIKRFDPVAVCYAGDAYADYYAPAIERGIFVRLKRRSGVSTSEIIERVRERTTLLSA
ncbi:MAG: adenylyltransferase/cytidyltransferase family protein [Rhodospirillaceae bacterium]|nr:adenylyltransferase/cytidyltransferase family protein [Rhodospirillaceae bacterium]